MKTPALVFAFFALILCVQPTMASAKTTYYNYAHNEAEYSVLLPEAPTVKTIWPSDAEEVSAYIDNPVTDSSSLGETAVFSRVDIDSEDMFDVKITFIKAPEGFLKSLTEEKIKDMLKKKTKEQALDHEDFKMSAGAGTLKWASLSGFTLDKNHHPAFSVIHYLTGKQSILVVEVFYTVENKLFQEYYKNLVDNITYNPP